MNGNHAHSEYGKRLQKVLLSSMQTSRHTPRLQILVTRSDGVSVAHLRLKRERRGRHVNKTKQCRSKQYPKFKGHRDISLPPNDGVERPAEQAENLRTQI